MAITLADFNKIWASTSPLSPYTFSDDNYNEGWNFIGQIPPSRQMWDFLQKNNDEKMQYLANNYLPLSGGTMTGNSAKITMGNGNSFISSYNTGIYMSADADTYYGTFLQLYTKANGNGFYLDAGDGTARRRFQGKPDGTLTWDGKSIPQRSYGVNLGANTTHTFDIAENGAVIFAKRGNDASCHMVTVWDATSTQFFVSGTDPITVSVSVGAKTATITNVSASSVAVKIINGGAL